MSGIIRRSLFLMPFDDATRDPGDSDSDDSEDDLAEWVPNSIRPIVATRELFSAISPQLGSLHVLDSQSFEVLSLADSFRWCNKLALEMKPRSFPLLSGAAQLCPYVERVDLWLDLDEFEEEEEEDDETGDRRRLDEDEEEWEDCDSDEAIDDDDEEIAVDPHDDDGDDGGDKDKKKETKTQDEGNKKKLTASECRAAIEKSKKEFDIIIRDLLPDFGVNLRHVDLRDTPVTEIAVSRISECPNITSLDLEYNNVDEKFIDHVMRLPALRKLDIRGNETLKSLETIYQKDTLHELLVGRAYDDNLQDDYLVGIPRLTNLKSLTINWCSVTGAEIAAIAKSQSIEKLELEGVLGFTRDNFAQLAQMPKLRHLSFRRDGSCGPDGPGIQAFVPAFDFWETLELFTGVQILCAETWMGMDGANVRKVAKMPSLSQLEIKCDRSKKVRQKKNAPIDWLGDLASSPTLRSAKITYGNPKTGGEQLVFNLHDFQQKKMEM